MPKKSKYNSKLLKSHRNPAGARTMGGSTFRSITVKKGKGIKKGY